MLTGYQDKQSVRGYLKFLNSTNGQLQQKFLFAAIEPLLPRWNKAAILDAACGSGWFLAILANRYSNLSGFDASPFLAELAKKTIPNANIQIADITQGLPFPPHHFDCIVLNMAGPDICNLKLAFHNLSLVLKPDGRLIISLPHPELTYPKAVWKRGIWGWLKNNLPKLKMTGAKLRGGQKIEREFGETKISSYYYSLQDYADAAANAGLAQKTLVEIRSKEDSAEFNLTYQLYRYPLLLVLSFEKFAK